MTEQLLALFKRLSVALRVFFHMLTDSDFALDVASLHRGEPPRRVSAEEIPAKPSPPLLQDSIPDSALQLLGLLQQEGRFVDFIEENMDTFSDSEIGAAARVVHAGCRKALHEHFNINPVRDEQEGTRVTLEAGFDAAAMRPTGNVSGEPPFIGTLVHRGWRATDIKLPKIAKSHDVSVLAPAEVEL